MRDFINSLFKGAQRPTPNDNQRDTESRKILLDLEEAYGVGDKHTIGGHHRPNVLTRCIILTENRTITLTGNHKHHTPSDLASGGLMAIYDGRHQATYIHSITDGTLVKIYKGGYVGKVPIDDSLVRWKDFRDFVSVWG